jgi:glycosyltransferase involved in cell wall biosynthesis
LAHVEYLGQLDRRDAQDILSRATLSLSPQAVALPRNSHGVSPLKVAESLMFGVPVVLSRVNVSANDIDEADVGCITMSDRGTELAIAVATLFEKTRRDPEIRDRASAFALSNLSWSRVGIETVEYVRALCTRLDGSTTS